MPNLTIPIRARVRKDVQDVLRKPWDSVSEAVDAVNKAMEPHNMFVDNDVDFSGDSGYESLLIRAHKDYKYLCSSCSENMVFDNVLALSWNKNEIVGYIS